MMSYLFDLQCTECGHSYPPTQPQTICTACNAPLLAFYDLGSVKDRIDRDEIRHRKHGMWRWKELLPVYKQENIITLGEGDSPLIRSERLGQELGLDNLYVKDESRNPTGTFKSRGLSTAISKAVELGVKKVIIPTAGNAGGAMAAYAARGGLQCSVIMPKDSPRANIEECRITGADVTLVDGLISDAAILAKRKANSEGWFDLSTFKEPYRVEGKKIMGYELAESFNWDLPEVLIYPTGGGTGLVGMWKAFNELAMLGWLDTNRRPRLVVVQAEGCAPVVKAYESGASACEIWENAHTMASGLRVPKSFADKLILTDLRESSGIAVSVSEEAIYQSQRRLAVSEGIFAAPEGAATLAGLIHLVDQRWIDKDERVVLFNTGSGLKYLSG